MVRFFVLTEIILSAIINPHCRENGNGGQESIRNQRVDGYRS